MLLSVGYQDKFAIEPERKKRFWAGKESWERFGEGLYKKVIADIELSLCE